MKGIKMKYKSINELLKSTFHKRMIENGWQIWRIDKNKKI